MAARHVIHIGAHWCNRAYPQAVDLGFDFCFLNPDTLGDAEDARAFVASGLDFVLNFFWTEDRLLNRDGAWVRDVEHAHAWLAERGLLGRCLAVQFDDEFYERVATNCGNPSVFRPAQWPILSTLAPRHGPSLLPLVADCHAERARQLADIFGADLPAGGFGCSATGAMELPTFRRQSWWGCDFYLGRPGWYNADIATVHRLYEGAARSGLTLMPIVGVFGEVGQDPPPLADLAACYLPILDRYATWAAGVFLLHHPGTWEPAHGEGRGLLELPAPYAAGVRWLTTAYGRVPSVLVSRA